MPHHRSMCQQYWQLGLAKQIACRAAKHPFLEAAASISPGYDQLCSVFLRETTQGRTAFLFGRATKHFRLEAMARQVSRQAGARFFAVPPDMLPRINGVLKKAPSPSDFVARHAIFLDWKPYFS